MQHIVVATDLSSAADNAVERAATVSTAIGAEIRLVHILPELLPPFIADRRLRMAERAMRYRAHGLRRNSGVCVSYNVMRGDTPRGIVRESENIDAVLTIFGSRNSNVGRRRFLSTTPERSMRWIRNAALIVRDQGSRPEPYSKALLAPETMAEADAMTSYVSRFAPSAGLHRIDLHRATGFRRAQRSTVERVRAMRRALDADLLVMGVSRDETLNPFRFRRLLSLLVREPDCDTLIVPHECTAEWPVEEGQQGIRIAS